MRAPSDHRAPRIVLLAAFLVLGSMTGACRQQPSGSDAAQGDPGSARKPYYQGLIDEYRKDLAEDPHNLAATIGLANALADSGKCREAIRYYEQALTFDPHNADVITSMGICYRNLGMVDRALETYARALTVDPTQAKALFNMGSIYGIDKKDYGKAIAAWEQLLRSSPNYPQADYVREAMKEFKRAQKAHAR